MVEPTAAASHHSGVLVAMGSLETAVQFGWKKLDPTLRWLAVQAAGTRIGCSWCIDYGYYEGMHEGIDPAKVRAVGDWRTSDLFDERERVVLEYAEMATGCPAEVSDELAARIRAHLSDAEFVELAAWVALENFRSRFNAGLGLRSQGFSDDCEIPMRARRGRRRTPLPDAEADAAAFEEWRSLLFGIAYRMLGSAADAEDVVQDASIRWLRRGDEPVQSVRAYLVTIVTRLCLDQLDSARSKRVTYAGPWLPEPVVVDETAAAEQADSLSLAFLVLLEELTPLERAAYLLHDVFGYSFEEVARSLGRSPAACRQLGARARQAHRGASPALRRRPAPRARADRPLPRRLCHRGPVGAPLHALRRRRGLDRRWRQGARGHAAGGRAVPQLEVPDQRGQEGARRPAGDRAQRPAGHRLRGRRAPSWRRSCSTSWTGPIVGVRVVTNPDKLERLSARLPASAAEDLA